MEQIPLSFFRDFKRKANLIQVLTYAALLSSSIFIPLLARDFGASNFEVGVIIAIFYFIYFLSSYAFGILSYRYSGKFFLQTGLLVSAALFLLQIFVHDKFSLLFLRTLAGFAAGIYPAALAVYAFTTREGKMGQFTGYGALGWAAGSVLAAVILDYKIIFVASSILFLGAFFVALRIKKELPRANPPLLPWKLIVKNLNVYLPYSLRSLGAQAVWTIFPLYLMGIGANKTWVAAAYFANAFSQFFITQYVEKFKNAYLIRAGIFTSIIVFLGYSLAPYFLWVIPLQILLAFAFSCLQVGAIQEIMRVNPERSSVVGILNSITNICVIAGAFIAGAIAEFFNYRGVMFFAAALTFLAFFSNFEFSSAK